MSARVKWTARLDHVQEVTLQGSASLGFWKARLAHEGLAPVDCEGRASMLIVSAAGKFMGLRFRELSVSVLVAADDVTSFFLVQAYSSNPFFAFCERRIFSTPYEAAEVGIVNDLPTSISVAQQGCILLQASMSHSGQSVLRAPVQECETAFVARVYVPRGANRRPAKVFFARIGGYTKVYRFAAGEDNLVIAARHNDDPLRILSASAFVPQAWIVRADATHAKSKTYKRSDIVDLERIAIDDHSNNGEKHAE